MKSRRLFNGANSSSNNAGRSVLKNPAHYPVTVICFFSLLANLHLFIPAVNANAAKGTQIFELTTLCKSQFPAQMHRKIDGAVIVSRNDKNLDCTVTFSAEYVSQRFLITFEEFNMECRDRLYIYDSANAIGNHRAELTCRYLGAENIRPIRTRGHYVTLKFVTDEWGTDDNKFTMIITAYKDSAQGCRDSFLCRQDNMCINNRLLCDDVRNCLDGTDELRAANCTTSMFYDFFSISVGSTVEILIIAGLVVVLLVTLVICSCLCQRRRERSMAPVMPPDISNHTKRMNEASGSNGAGSMISIGEKRGAVHTGQAKSTTLDSIHKPVNSHLPAASQGYTMILPHLLPRYFMGAH